MFKFPEFGPVDRVFISLRDVIYSDNNTLMRLGIYDI